MRTCLLPLLGFALTCIVGPAQAQTRLTGSVIDSVGKPLPGAGVRLIKADRSIPVGPTGTFFLLLPDVPDTLLVTHVGYMPEKLAIGPNTVSPFSVMLHAHGNVLEEVVVNTGYYAVPAERATGAFTYIDNELLNRSPSTNILDRLEGVTNGLLFDRRNLTGENVDGAPELRIRGLSTIDANSAPLIVVDNFPYEGDINTLNPNMVESITVLRDAAAASIWGARAGNGVIVITTKQGKYNQPARVSFNTNLNFRDKPDLLYGRQYLPAPTVMEIQKELFERGAYAENNQTYIPSYVELLIKLRDGLIEEADFAAEEALMRNTDLRRQALDHLYQVGLTQQYALNITGGGQHYRYALAGGYDRQRTNSVGNGNDRLSLNMQNHYRVTPNLELDGGIWFSQQQGRHNGLDYHGIGVGNNAGNSYDRLINPDGSAATIGGQYRQAYREQAVQEGLLDWIYRPLDEMALNDRRTLRREWRMTAGAGYSFLNGFRAQASYQYQLSGADGQDSYHEDSYYVRNLVNRFTQSDGTRIIPYGGIMEYAPHTETQSHSGRMQLNYRHDFSSSHQVAILGGAELRQDISTTTPGNTLYSFDESLWNSNSRFDYATFYPMRPIGISQIPSISLNGPYQRIDRFLSYFGNGSYTFRQRYILSGSIRWDASNLLGVKTNQRGTSLWSVGGSWELSGEPFYPFRELLPYSRLRVTYGSAGNIDKSQSHYPTISMMTNTITGLQQANLTHAGNPSLRWEQVNTLNLGLDWRSRNQRFSGSLEYYSKEAKYLLGDNMMDPTTGINVGSVYKMNYGDLRTTGWDIQLNTRNLTGPFSWTSTLLASRSTNRITHFNGPEPLYTASYLTSRVPEAGKSVDVIYALPWYGLSPENGMPLIKVDGQNSTDPSAYRDYYLNFPKEGLVKAGVLVPKVFGSLRNTFEWKGFQASAVVVFKAGHVFRRQSIGPGQEYVTSDPVYHTDYFKRWQKPGDELHTDVPAWAETPAPDQRYVVYQMSEALITSGDVIRLQDINFSYALDKRHITRLPVESVRVYAYARNLGILWRSNSHGIDPDYPNADYPEPKSFALGVQIGF